MVFQLYAITNLKFFEQILQFFSYFSTFIGIIQVVWVPGARKPHYGLDNELLKNF